MMEGNPDLKKKKDCSLFSPKRCHVYHIVVTKFHFNEKNLERALLVSKVMLNFILKASHSFSFLF